MKTILQIRIHKEDYLDDFKKLLQNDFSKLNGDKRFESLLLRDADNKKFDFVENLDFSVLEDNDSLINKYKESIEKLNGDFFIQIGTIFKDGEESLHSHYLIEIILDRLSLLMNLSYNTSVDFMESIYMDDSLSIIGVNGIIITDINLAYKHAKDIKWPIIEEVTIFQVIEMFSFNDYSLEGISVNNFQRAVNCFSHLFGTLNEKSADHLFWNMVGIESLLSKGNKDIQAQIKQKSSLILGEPTEFKKKINKLYEFRSKLVHGKRDFPAKFSEDIDSYEDEYWDYNSFATSILLSLIRHLIKNKKYDFEFEYKYLL